MKKWLELREKTLQARKEQKVQNTKDKVFWTLLLEDVTRYTPKKTRGHALRRKFG